MKPGGGIFNNTASNALYSATTFVLYNWIERSLSIVESNVPDFPASNNCPTVEETELEDDNRVGGQVELIYNITTYTSQYIREGLRTFVPV